MNWLDAAIVLVVVWFTFSAFSAGFLRETVTIFASILGVILAGLFYRQLADDVLLAIDNETTARLVAFAAIFVATVVAGHLAAMLLKPAVDVLQLGVFDQLAGAAFGFLKAMLFVQVFLIVIVTYPTLGLKDTIDGSVFGSFIVEHMTAPLIKVLPVDFKSAVDLFGNVT